MFACSERPCWVAVKDSIAEGKAVPGPARRRLPASPCGRSCSVPTQGGCRLQGGAAKLALIKTGACLSGGAKAAMGRAVMPVC